MTSVIGEFAAIGSSFCWAFSSVLLKVPATRLRAFYITAYRMGFTALLVVVAAAAAGQLDEIADIPFHAILVLILSAAVVIIGDVAFFRAFALDDLSRVFTVTTGLYILFSVIASVVFTDESLTWWMVLGGVLVVLGISLISETGRGVQAARTERRRGMPLQAMLFATFTAVTWTAGLMALNEGMQYTDPLPGAALRMPVMPLVLIPFIMINGDVRRFGWGGRDKFALMLSGLFGGGSGLLFMTAVKYASPGVVAILSSASPVFVLVMTTLLLRERPSRRSLVGTAVCMGGIVLTSV